MLAQTAASWVKKIQHHSLGGSLPMDMVTEGRNGALCINILSLPVVEVVSKGNSRGSVFSLLAMECSILNNKAPL